MHIEEVTHEIGEIVKWYHCLEKDFTGITDLMYNRVQLSTLLFYYASELGEIRKQWRGYEIETERVKRSETKKMMESGQPMSKSIEFGKFKSLDEYATEKQFDGLYNSMNFYYQATIEVLNNIFLI